MTARSSAYVDSRKAVGLPESFEWHPAFAQAGQAASMLTVAVPSSFSGRGIFTGADVVTDSFGAGKL